MKTKLFLTKITGITLQLPFTKPELTFRGREVTAVAKLALDKKRLVKINTSLEFRWSQSVATLNPPPKIQAYAVMHKKPTPEQLKNIRIYEDKLKKFRQSVADEFDIKYGKNR